MNTINLNISTTDVVNLLIDRVIEETSDPDVIALYREMYERDVDDPNVIFDDPFHAKTIVSNDMACCYVITEDCLKPDDPTWDDLLKYYEHNEFAVYRDDGVYFGYIEAVSDDEQHILVRGD